MKRIVFISFIILLCIFVAFQLIKFKEKTPKLMYEFILDKVPISGVSKGDTWLFLYDDGTLELNKIQEDKRITELIANDISLVSLEHDTIAVVDKKNFFWYISNTLSNTKQSFANEVNERALVYEIKRIVSGNDFTAVLFEDGVVYSDIDYANKNETTQYDFEIFKNCDVKKISAASYYILALDRHDSVYGCGRTADDTLNYSFVENYNDSKELYVSGEKSYILTNDRNVFVFDSFDLMVDDKITPVKYEIDKIEKMSVYDGVELAYSTTGQLYHWGMSYNKKPKLKVIVEHLQPQLLTISDNIAYFCGTKYGIAVVTENGRLKIYKN